jgi:hypothetical protein
MFPFLFSCFHLFVQNILAVLFILFVPSFLIRIYFHIFVLSSSYFLVFNNFSYSTFSFLHFFFTFLLYVHLELERGLTEGAKLGGGGKWMVILGEMNKLHLTNPDLTQISINRETARLSVPFCYTYCMCSLDALNSNLRVLILSWCDERGNMSFF